MGVSMLNDDSARMKAPRGSRRAAGHRVRLQPPQLPLDPARQPFPSVSVSGRMALVTGISRVSSTNRYRRFLQGQTPSSTLVQPLLLRLRACRRPFEEKDCLYRRHHGILQRNNRASVELGFVFLSRKLRELDRYFEGRYVIADQDLHEFRASCGRAPTAVVCPDGGLSAERVGRLRAEPLGR